MRRRDVVFFDAIANFSLLNVSSIIISTRIAINYVSRNISVNGILFFFPLRAHQNASSDPSKSPPRDNF